MANSKFQTFDHLLRDEEDELMNAGYRVFEQRGGGKNFTTLIAVLYSIEKNCLPVVTASKDCWNT